MRKLWVVCKNELKRYFVSPLAYVYLLSFLILNGSFAIYFGDFFNLGQANLLSMFAFQPWLYLLFISGISMRLWSEEFRTKTIVQIVTMPVSIRTLVLGKFFASWIFCGLALALSFPFWITVNILGNPDNNVIMLGYVASFMLAGCMLAISQTMSALTKNQVIALVLAVLANLFFFWSGIEYVLAFFRTFLPDSIIAVIASFSFITHFNSLTYGLLELRDLIFFISIICFFNFTTILVINFKTAGTSGWLKSTNKSYYLIAWSILFLGFFGVNILANNLTRTIQFDATEEKIFTLTENTKRILKNLKEPVLGKLYFSPILEQRNPALRTAFDNIKVLLQKYKDVSDGKFDFKVYHPQFLSQEEDIALAGGIQPIPLIDINQNAMFGMTFEDAINNKSVIPFFTLSQQGATEQEITNKIRSLYHKKKVIGVLTGLPIFGSQSADGTALGQPWKFIDVINENYKMINITRPSDFDNHFDALLIFAPKKISEEYLEKIKEYSQNIGNVLLILDPINEASRLYSYENKNMQSSVLEKLGDLWGIKFYDDYVIADLQNSITVDATTDYKKNPIFSQDVIQFKIKEADFNPKHPITKNLHQMMFASASVIMPQDEPFFQKKIEFIPLLKASPISSMMTAKVVTDGLNPQQILKYFQPDDNQKFIAAEVRGKEANNQFDLIVVGDSDFLYDSFWLSSQNLLQTEHIDSEFDNVNFIMNALDYLTLDADLLSLRGKKAKLRRFADIENMRRVNSLKYKQQEEDIFEKMELTKKSMQEVWSKKNFEERENFTADEIAVMANVRNKLDELRIELSNLRNQAFDDIQCVALRVSLFNIWLIPLLIIVALTGWGTVACLRRKKIRYNAKIFDNKLAKLGLICLIIFVSGLVSTYMTNRSDIDNYEGKFVFENARKKINDINRIEFTAHNKQLVFVQNDGIWQVEENDSLPVYQERIRRFLNTVTDAKFFQRKSDKAENLEKFNLLPIEDENSKALVVELKNGEEIVERFELGNIDIDLGRGSRAAFIKFDNKFQVWEIAADFVDMDISADKWTYSNLWDLRFGRIYSPENNPETENRLLMMIKYILNTQIADVTDLPKSNPVAEYTLYIEGGDKVKMLFYQENGVSYVAYDFEDVISNHYLSFFAKYLRNKAVIIADDSMEKILEQVK